MIFIVFSILICILYCSLIYAFYYGWKQTKAFTSHGQNPKTFVSIIVAVRNEEQNIANLLNDLSQQDFPISNFEILVINDSSTDNTLTVLEEKIQEIQNLFFYNLPTGSIGKKAAISYALEKSKGSLIVTTDGDCTMGQKWLSEIVSFYETYKPEMIIAPVFFNKEKTIFGNLQNIEFSSLIAAGAGAAGINKPIMCNAANMAFEKKTLIDNHEHFNTNFASGDDMFLLHHLKNLKKELLFLKSTNAVVYTKSQPDLKSFIAQRIRWAGKSKGYTDAETISTAMIIFLMNLVLFGTFILGFFHIYYLSVFGFLFSLKSIVDILLLNSFLRFFKQEKQLIWFVPMQTIYFVYVSLIGIFGFFVKVSWKGRKI